MENKEIRNTAAELNDETLENVNGGLLVPIPSAAISLFRLANRTRTALPGCGFRLSKKVIVTRRRQTTNRKSATCAAIFARFCERLGLPS